MMDRSSSYETHYFDYDQHVDAHYCAVDVGGPADSTVAVLMRYTLKGGGDFIINHAAKTRRQRVVSRYDIKAVKRMSPDLSHTEQAEQIAAWISNDDGIKVRSVLNVSDIGEPAARSFRVLRPWHFNKNKDAEHLRSLIVRSLNANELKLADDVALGDMDTERCGDARAVALALWSVSQRVTRQELRI